MNKKAMMFDSKRKYVESLNAVLSVKRDFEAIEYAHSAILEEEYMRIRDNLGRVFYTNITGCTEELILNEIALAILEKPMNGRITSLERIREIAPLFRKVA